MAGAVVAVVVVVIASVTKYERLVGWLVGQSVGQSFIWSVCRRCRIFDPLILINACLCVHKLKKNRDQLTRLTPKYGRSVRRIDPDEVILFC